MHTILGLPDVKRSKGLSRSTIYLRIVQGIFLSQSVWAGVQGAGWKPKCYSDGLKRAAAKVAAWG
jgi:predicted DNA-binding transcriptional regulator AlpA